MALSLIMILSPASAAASAGLVITAKYHGVAVPENYLDTYGCGKAKTVQPWKFDLKTGVGGSSSTGSVGECKKTLDGVGTSSDAEQGGGFEVAIPFKVTASTTNVTANIASKVALTLKASNGVASNTAPAPKCNDATPFSEFDAFYEWNYSLTPYGYYDFNDINYSEYYNSTSYSYAYTYGNAATPSPFNLNNTTLEELVDYSGISGYCEAETFMYLDQDVDLVDNTNGTYIPATSGNLLDYADFFMYTYTDIDYVCGYDFYWYGPSNYTFGNTTSMCISYNTTSSYIDYDAEVGPSYTYTYTYSSGTNNTMVYSLPTNAFASSTSWDYSFVASHHYSFEWSVYMYIYGYDSWKKGSASWAFNAATGGDGIKLTNLSLT